ncbi:MAG: NAD(P)/FAD-dependent oxidoreductase [Planctomycetota bacterium]|jgi:thioredoxin reductase (NADPH)|nr:NAD(P)/FAD-dependent oxidoreductase [Planctomycetota bacterium]MDP6988322.1 NAD(P)/FAD-dependent oxidoreductase [Planctomycetota bacterium]
MADDIDELFDLAVIGAGGAGTMAFLRGVLNYDRCVLFSGDARTRRKGRSTWVSHVDNIPGMHGLGHPIGKSTKCTLEWIEGQEGLRDRGTVIKAVVERLERSAGGFVCRYEDKRGSHAVRARFVVLATGCMDVQPQIGGSIKPVFPFPNRGDFIYCVRCDGHLTRGKELSVIGASDSAVSLGAMMADRYGHEGVAILENGLEGGLGEEARALASAYGMQLHASPIAKILGDPRDRGLEGFRLVDGTRVDTTCCIVSLGIIAYNSLLCDLGGEVDASGRAVVGEAGESSIPGLFVVGDLQSGRKMQVYTAWDEAVDSADEINARIRAERRGRRLGAAPGER